MTHIKFDEKNHTYTNVNNNKKYLSVTKFINQFVTPFDSEYFSMYKAIEEIMGVDKFKQYKKLIGFKNNVVVSYLNNDNFQQVKEKQKEILDKWDLKSKLSIEKGNKYHKQKELDILEGKPFNWDSIDYYSWNYALYSDNVVLPEEIVYLDEFELSGTVDLILKRFGTELILFDYKTSEDLKKENKYQKMLFPLDKLEDCKFNHYQVQLSLYAYMLEQNTGLKVTELYVIHLDKDDQEVLHKCKYLKDEVLKMLEVRKRQLNAETDLFPL